MGNKTHPIGFRLGIVKDWQATWFAGKQREYRNLVVEDVTIRKTIANVYPDAGVSRVEIERGSNDVVVTIHTARPGIVIGRGGQKVEDLRKELEGRIERRVRLNVQEVRQPELDAFLVARSVADQLVRRIAYRRAIRQAIGRTMQAGAQGIKIVCSGRLGGGDIARREKAMEGRVPLHTLRADIDYNLAEAATTFGRIGVKVWIFKGEILPTPVGEEEEMMPIEVTLRAQDGAAVVDELGGEGVEGPFEALGRVVVKEEEGAVAARPAKPPEVEAAVAEVEAAVAEVEAAVAEVGVAVAEVETAVPEKEAAVAEVETAVAEVETAVAEVETAVAEVETAVAKKEAAVAKKEAAVAKKETAVAEKETAVAEKETAVAEKETAVAEKEAVSDDATQEG